MGGFFHTARAFYQSFGKRSGDKAIFFACYSALNILVERFFNLSLYLVSCSEKILIITADTDDFLGLFIVFYEFYSDLSR